MKLTDFVTGVEQVVTVRWVRDEFVDTERLPTSSLVEVAGCSGRTCSSRSRVVVAALTRPD